MDGLLVWKEDQEPCGRIVVVQRVLRAKQKGADGSLMVLSGDRAARVVVVDEGRREKGDCGGNDRPDWFPTRRPDHPLAGSLH